MLVRTGCGYLKSPVGVYRLGLNGYFMHKILKFRYSYRFIGKSLSQDP